MRKMVRKADSKGRERVIQDIETVEQAVKAERDVEMGYFHTIDENVLLWIATEEDMIQSYTKLLLNTDNRTKKDTFKKIIEQSKRHLLTLTEIRKGLGKIASDEQRHARMLEALREK